MRCGEGWGAGWGEVWRGVGCGVECGTVNGGVRGDERKDKWGGGMRAKSSMEYWINKKLNKLINLGDMENYDNLWCTP